MRHTNGPCHCGCKKLHLNGVKVYFLRINGMGHLCAFRSHQKMQYACATESTLRCDRMKGQLFFRKVKYCYENKNFQIFLIFPRAPRRSAPQHGACAHLVLDPRTLATFIRSPGPSRSVRVYVLIYDDDYYW